jgi:hypothetical protein
MNMTNKSVILTILLLGNISAFAQVDTAWVRRYNGPGNSGDTAVALAIDGFNNVYVTGVSDGDYATIKYYADGDTAWVRRYHEPGNGYDRATDIAVDDFGNAYVTGFSGSWPSYDYATIKYYSSGDTAWVRRYNGPGNSWDEACAIAADDSGNVYVTGYSLDSGTNFDYTTIKYYYNGDTAWVRRYNGPGDGGDYASAIAVDASGKVYVTGYSLGSGTNYDYASIKYYPNGDTAWVRRYNGPGNSHDEATAIAINDSGNVYVTGRSWGNGTYADYTTIKYCPNGDTGWVRRYNGSGNGWDEASAITVDDSGNIYVSGCSEVSFYYPDYLTIKYAPDGEELWVGIYNGPGNNWDEASAIATDGSGNLYVTGYSVGSGIFSDYATIKYYPDGDTGWVARYNRSGNNYDLAYAIAVDGADNVYVTGCSWGNETYEDYATIKYIQATEVKNENENKEKPSEFALYQNYPNPFNPATTIPFTVHSSQKTVNDLFRTTLTIYNILGQKVRTLVDEDKLPGEYKIVWDGRDGKGTEVASGIYFYRIQADDFSRTKRMLLLR